MWRAIVDQRARVAEMLHRPKRWRSEQLALLRALGPVLPTKHGCSLSKNVERTDASADRERRVGLAAEFP